MNMTFDSPIDPYRTPGYVKPKPKEKKPMKVPYITYVAGIATSFALSGMSCQYFNRGLPADHVSTAGIGVSAGILSFAVYLGIVLGIKINKDWD